MTCLTIVYQRWSHRRARSIQVHSLMKLNDSRGGCLFSPHRTIRQIVERNDPLAPAVADDELPPVVGSLAEALILFWLPRN